MPINTTSRGRFGWAWLVAVGVWGLLWPILTGVVINRYTDTTANFIEALYQRKDVAMASVPASQGRIVIIGGSDALFGIDAEQLQRDLGRPVINYATHAALGIEYTLDRARRVLRPGDVAVLEFAYGMWKDRDGEFGEYEFAYFTSYDKAYYLRMGLRRAIRALYSVPLRDYADSTGRWWKARGGRQARWDAMYSIETMDTRGDLRQTVPGPLVESEAGILFTVAKSRVTGTVLEFSRWARENRIQVFYTWPSLARPSLVPVGVGQEPPAWLTAVLDASSITVLDRPVDNLYPPQWFYDTTKHLNSSGRRVRTEALGRRLAEALGRPAAPARALYLLGGPDAGLAPLENLPPAPVTYRYLSDQALDQPESMTPRQVRDAVRDGNAVFYDDPDVEPLLAMHGLRGRQIMQREVTLGEFLRRFDHHLVIAVRGMSDPWTGEVDSGLPQVLREALESPGAFAVAVGTGPYKSVARHAQGQVRLARRVSDLVGKVGPRLDLDVRAVPPTLKVNQRAPVSAGQGVRVVAIDPAAGVVSDGAVFERSDSTVVRGRRYQVTEGSLEVRNLEPEEFRALGDHPPDAEAGPDGVTIQPRGAAGVWGVSLRSEEIPSDGGMLLTVEAQAGSRYNLLVVTNRPELFRFLPSLRTVTGDGSAREVSLRWQLHPGAVWKESDVAIAALVPWENAAPLVVQRATLIQFSQ